MNAKLAKKLRKEVRKQGMNPLDGGNGESQYKQAKKAASITVVSSIPKPRFNVPSAGKASNFKGFRKEWRKLVAEQTSADGLKSISYPVSALIADYSMSEEKKERRSNNALRRAGRG